MKNKKPLLLLISQKQQRRNTSRDRDKSLFPEETEKVAADFSEAKGERDRQTDRQTDLQLLGITCMHGRSPRLCLGVLLLEVDPIIASITTSTSSSSSSSISISIISRRSRRSDWKGQAFISFEGLL